jgi:hypothetical protein
MIEKWKTLKEIENEYNIAANTLRWHINKDNIPKEHIKKIGKTWIINEEWVESKYKKRV